MIETGVILSSSVVWRGDGVGADIFRDIDADS